VVRIDGRPAHKAAEPVAEEATLSLSQAEPVWVSRAAGKLVAALEQWGPQGLLVQGRQALDLGASTGGFTEVLLAHGAASVVALDVGHDQLVPALVADPRVHDVSGTSLRDTDAAYLLRLGANLPDGRADLVVADLSFISLTLVLDRIADLVRAAGDVVLLVKPQFEVGRGRLGKRGIVTNPAYRTDALHTVVTATVRAGLAIRGLAESPVTGGHGNIEYLLWARPDGSGKMDAADIEAAVQQLGSKGPK
jgi:23S rRNA (cytidine1920-2'-O)/16S rRNA (cytidine1409-2'-O)-methyltransferase